MKDPVFVAFFHPEGRSRQNDPDCAYGELSLLRQGMKVLVGTATIPQYSIKEMRDRDVEILKINKTLSEI